jgi:molybdenum cofactor cytidylyltransferase
VKFGLVPVEEAVGALAAHSVRAGETVVRKGRLISMEMATQLKQAGVEKIIVARLEPDDIGEDKAACRLADALAGENVIVEKPFTGRSNLYAGTSGILLIDIDAINGLNAINEAMTVATLPAHKPVVAGEMIATVKIIPYAIPGVLLEDGIIRAGTGALRIAPYTRRHVGVISTVLPGLKSSVIDKTVAVLAKRLQPANASIVLDHRVPHDTTELTRQLACQAAGDTQFIVVFGASAIADRRDVIPSAIEMAGGHVEHFGMPVDPGNLLLIGSIAGKPILGAPGCARSAKENGFDWILHRVLADIPVTRADIMALGVGGLLMEIVSRPQPRAGGESGDEESGNEE